MLQDQFHDANRFMRDQKRARRQFDTASLMFIRKQIDLLGHMDKEIEIVEDDRVQKGVFDDSHLRSEELMMR